MLLAAIDTTADDKLTRFAIRLALSSHVAVPRENEPDFLTEADAVFAPKPQPKQKARIRKSAKPTLVSPPAKKATAGKKKITA